MPAYFVSHENEFAIGQPRLEETALIRKRKLLDILEETAWKLAEREPDGAKPQQKPQLRWSLTTNKLQCERPPRRAFS